jgi:hypothetical protein
MEPIDCTGSPAAAPLTGVAAGVLYVALPPSSGSGWAPLVVAWHLLGPPPSPQAMAAPLPMARLSAWRVYPRLPMLDARGPLGDPEDVVRCGAEEVVFSLPSPVIERAVAGFPAVAAALRAWRRWMTRRSGWSAGWSVLPPAPQAGPNDQSLPTADHPRGAAPMTSHPALDMASVAMSGRR